MRDACTAEARQLVLADPATMPLRNTAWASQPRVDLLPERFVLVLEQGNARKEMTGAPVISFCRIDDKEIRLREPILEPDALIVQDPTLFKVVDVCQGLKPTGYLLVNSNRSLAELVAFPQEGGVSGQFFALSTSLFLPIHGIMPRSFAPTSSIWWLSFMRRMPLKREPPALYSCIQSDVNLPVWMSCRTRFISALVSAVMMRGPETYSPHSAVFEIE